jgi:hypothetical protein
MVKNIKTKVNHRGLTLQKKALDLMRDPANDSLLCRSGRRRIFHSDLHLITSSGESNLFNRQPTGTIILNGKLPCHPNYARISPLANAIAAG